MSNNKSDAFEELYLKQKKKSSILMAVVVILALTTVGSLVWGAGRTSTGSQTPAGFQGGDGQGFPGGSGPGGAGMGQMDFKQFFTDGGSVDSEAVQKMVDRLPSGAGSQFLDRFTDNINQAAEDGDITDEQAKALIEAFKTASEKNNG